MRLVNGVADCAIVKEFELSVDSVRRHRESHLPKLMMKGKELKEITNADVLLSRAEELYNEAWELLRIAKSSGDIKTALSGVGQASRLVELLGRLLGEIKDTKVVNVMTHPDTRELISIVVGALDGYPDARANVLRMLKERFMNGQDIVDVAPTEMN